MSDENDSSAPPPPDGTALAVEDLPVLPPETAPSLGEPVLRPKSSLWDRLRILLALVALFWLLTWGTATNNPIEPFGDVLNHQVHSLLWLEVLIGLELIRQVHYFISEHSRHWYHFWNVRVFGRLHRATGRISDWNRYRMGRVLRVLFWLAMLAIVLGAFYHVSPLVALFQIPAALFTALPFILQLAFAFFFVIFQFIGLFWFLSKGGIDTYYPGDVKTRFHDVWGQDSVLERVKENIIFLRNPEAIENRGGYVPGGILLWGPPGTGKTLMAEAVAGETGNPFVFVDPGAFNNMFMGVGVLKVKSLFRKLRRLALRYGGVVVFFDEADSLGNRGALSPGGVFRSSQSQSGSGAANPFEHHDCHGLSYLPSSTQELLMRSAMSSGAEEAPSVSRGRLGMMMGGMAGGGGMGTLQSLLSELSGLSKPRGFFNRIGRRALGMQPKPPPKYRILVMMATNMPQSLDEALLRPGRIDRIYKVGYPSKAGRIRTYQGYLDKVAHNLTPSEIERLATITPYATGATIKDLVNEALINTIRNNREVITWRDIIAAKHLKDLGPPEDVEYIERERHAVAIHEACHAFMAVKVLRNLVIDISTIEKGGNYLGFVSQVQVADTFTEWRSDYEATILVNLASLAGEKLFFEGDNSSGVRGDLETATTIATFMEGYWGMGKTVASHGVTVQAGIPGGGSGGDRTRNEGRRLFDLSLGGRIEGNLVELLGRAAEILNENRLAVFGIAHALEAHKTITGEDVVAIIQGTEGPFVDGRRYRTQQFLDLAEAYHHDVVNAHKQRGSIEPHLPRLPDLAELGEGPFDVIGNGAPVLATAPVANGASPSGAAEEGETTTEPTESA